jgi:hypothetical protein
MGKWMVCTALVALFGSTALLAQSGSAPDATLIERLTIFTGEGAGTGTAFEGGGVASGTAKGDPFGIATWTFTQGSGGGFPFATLAGFCVADSGNAILTTPSGSVLFLDVMSFGCSNTTASNTSATFNGAFVINPTLSKGKFAGATGSGNIVVGAYAQQSVAGPVFLHINGNIKLQ